ncbi:protein takeout-like [Aphidius gifuensis]|uniref:protein takeout-like n=1 Tax=Aphidius gifuensis TaxID=684658 RepID=UPI001CDC2711|nr:protein takeout-like [Aphidius gifuensis]
MRAILLALLMLIVVVKIICQDNSQESFIICPRQNLNFNECMQRNLEIALRKWRNGNAALNIIPMDPMFIESFYVDEVDGNGIRQIYKNISVTGLIDNITISNLKFDFNNLTLSLNVFAPKLIFASDYVLKGKMYSVPIHGDGKCQIILKNIMTKHLVRANMIDINNREHLKIHEWQVSLEPEDVKINFSNLYNGNWFLSAPAYWVIEHYPFQLFEELQKPFIQFFSVIFTNISNSALKIVPFDTILSG